MGINLTVKRGRYVPEWECKFVQTLISYLAIG